MSDITYRNCGPATPIVRAERYRISWELSAAFILPNSGFQTKEVAERLREFLPSVGLIPVSVNVSQDGQPAIVYAVQLGQLFKGTTVADIVTAANNLPIFTSGISLRLALDVIGVEQYKPASSSVDAQGLNAALIRAIAKVEQGDIATVAANVGSSVTKTVKQGLDTIQIVAIAIIAVAGVYAYTKLR